MVSKQPPSLMATIIIPPMNTMTKMMVDYNNYQEGQEEGVNYTSVDANTIYEEEVDGEDLVENAFQDY